MKLLVSKGKYAGITRFSFDIRLIKGTMNQKAVQTNVLYNPRDSVY